MSAERADSRVVIVGAGVAGVATARSLRANGFEGRVLLISGEDTDPYDRPPLSKQLLAGSMSTSDLVTLSRQQAAELAIDLHLADPAGGLDTDGRRVLLASGRTVSYDRLVVATGSRPRRLSEVLPDVPVSSRIHYLRDLSDAEAFRDALTGLRSLVVVGGGFIGLEVASAARDRGVDVTVLESGAQLLGRVLDPVAAGFIEEMHREHGVDIRLGAQVDRVAELPSHLEVTLSDGTPVTADALMVGIGAVPNVEWLGDALAVDHGIVCGPDGATSADGVYAVGDVSRWFGSWMPSGERIEQWQAALEHGEVVGRNIAQPTQRSHWSSVPYFWSDQYGRKIQLCGRVGERSEVFRTAQGPVVLYGDGAQLCGVVAFHQPRVVALARRLLARAAPWSEASAWAGTLAA
jgi:3-phenylpropionate/trans-cinnamate dioxygenase ferredoxin reductase subunit